MNGDWPPTRISQLANGASYAGLIKAVASDRGINDVDLARTAGVTPSALSHILASERACDPATLSAVLTHLAIDPLRAQLAVEHFGDLARYFDPGLAIVCDLARCLPDHVRGAACEAARFDAPITVACVSPGN